MARRDQRELTHAFGCASAVPTFRLYLALRAHDTPAGDLGVHNQPRKNIWTCVCGVLTICKPSNRAPSMVCRLLFLCSSIPQTEHEQLYAHHDYPEGVEPATTTRYGDNLRRRTRSLVDKVGEDEIPSSDAATSPLEADATGPAEPGARPHRHGKHDHPSVRA
eukprot:scaffold301_cov393-Prasinococcus_capsulatus_cf.AAC.18